jgi:ATP-dependent DNA helicase RecQ
LYHPRQLTRFLCGLTSPSASRAKLAMHASFGALSDVPFFQVLTFVEDEARRFAARAKTHELRQIARGQGL